MLIAAAKQLDEAALGRYCDTLFATVRKQHDKKGATEGRFGKKISITRVVHGGILQKDKQREQEAITPYEAAGQTDWSDGYANVRNEKYGGASVADLSNLYRLLFAGEGVWRCGECAGVGFAVCRQLHLRGEGWGWAVGWEGPREPPGGGVHNNMGGGRCTTQGAWGPAGGSVQEAAGAEGHQGAAAAAAAASAHGYTHGSTNSGTAHSTAPRLQRCLPLFPMMAVASGTQ